MRKNPTCRIVLSAIVCILFGAALSAQTLDPAAYLETSRAAVSLPRVIAAYNAYIDEQDPVFYGIFDVDLTTQVSTIASTVGALGGTFAGIDGFFYVRLFKLGDISFRALFLPSFFAFNMDSATKSAHPVFGDETFFKWLSGYALFGVQARRGLDRLTLGAVLLVEPLVDTGANEFDFEATADGIRTETTSLDRFYADVSFEGWRFGTMISAEYLEQLAAEKLFDLASDRLRAGPVLEYLGRAGSFRPGLGAEWRPVPWFEAAAQAKMGISEDYAGLGEAGVELSLYRPLIRDIRKSGKDMTLRLGLQGSVCEFEGSLTAGGKAEATLLNYPFLTWFDLMGLKYLGSITLGVSWNHADTLVRMPFEDQLIVYIRTGGGYYARPRAEP